MSAKKYFLLSAFGKDRPGIVAGVTEALYAAGANIEDASMTRLGGEFSMMLVAALPPTVPPARLMRAMNPVKKRFAVELSLRPVPAVLAVARRRQEPGAMISVYGTDKPGIVRSVARLLARRRVNITDLNTKVLSASGADLYIMMLEVQLPASLSADTLRQDLEALKGTLGVDITLQDLEAVPL